MILVTGATGRIGGAVLRELARAGQPVRALVRDAGKLPPLPGVQAAVADLDPPRLPPGLFDGVTALFLVTPDDERQVGRETRLLRAATARGVGRVVKLSSALAGLPAPVSFGRRHAAVEQALLLLTDSWTLLRPALLCETLPVIAPGLAARGSMELPVRDAQVAFVRLADVARAATRVLLEPGHAGRAYALTGPAALNFAEVARLVAGEAGRPVAFRPVPPLLARLALPLVAGLSWRTAGLVVQMMRALEAGAQAGVTDDLPRLLGRPAGDLAGWVRENRALFGAGPLADAA